MAEYITEFVVKGKGAFPLDMLRYDSCWPATSQDASAIHESFEFGSTVFSGEELRVELKHIQSWKGWKPTEGRWESFGWKVTKFETHRI